MYLPLFFFGYIMDQLLDKPEILLLFAIYIYILRPWETLIHINLLGVHKPPRARRNTKPFCPHYIPMATAVSAPVSTATVRVSNIPPSAVAKELLAFFDSAVAGAGEAYACEIAAARRGWLSRGDGSV